MPTRTARHTWRTDPRVLEAPPRALGRCVSRREPPGRSRQRGLDRLARSRFGDRPEVVVRLLRGRDVRELRAGAQQQLERQRAPHALGGRNLAQAALARDRERAAVSPTSTARPARANTAAARPSTWASSSAATAKRPCRRRSSASRTIASPCDAGRARANSRSARTSSASASAQRPLQHQNTRVVRPAGGLQGPEPVAIGVLTRTLAPLARPPDVARELAGGEHRTAGVTDGCEICAAAGDRGNGGLVEQAHPHVDVAGVHQHQALARDAHRLEIGASQPAGDPRGLAYQPPRLGGVGAMPERRRSQSRARRARGRARGHRAGGTHVLPSPRRRPADRECIRGCRPARAPGDRRRGDRRVRDTGGGRSRTSPRP